MTDASLELLSVLRTRREYCRAMLDLSHRQQSLIEQNRTGDLLRLIEQKQRVLDGLAGLARSFGGLADYWKQHRHRLPEPVRRECEQILADSEALVARTLEVEALGTGAMTRRRDETQRQLRELHEQAATRSASLRHGPGDRPGSSAPRFLDVSR